MSNCTALPLFPNKNCCKNEISNSGEITSLIIENDILTINNDKNKFRIIKKLLDNENFKDFYILERISKNKYMNGQLLEMKVRDNILVLTQITKDELSKYN